MTPTKRINTGADLDNFKKSEAYKRIHVTIVATIEKIRGSDLPPSILNASIVTKGSLDQLKDQQLPLVGYEDTVAKFSEPIQAVIQILDLVDRLIDTTPPADGPRRFGNLEFRLWQDKVAVSIDLVLQEQLYQFLPGENAGFLEEVKHYFEQLFGLKMRLDYGTGHELLFMAFIGALTNEGVINWETVTAVEVLAVYARYYDVIRRLILVYNLEPAGSHGVWGLDDHFHLIYILGAAQFVDNSLAPAVQAVLLNLVLSQYKLTNLYVNGVAFINVIKLGPFHEHLPIINDIHTSVPSWNKVTKGLVKMYEVEVLGKFPVVQHFWFGHHLYPWRDLTGRQLPISDPVDTSAPTNLPTMAVHTTKDNVSMTAAPWARR